jgi:hypothetical protein
MGSLMRPPELVLNIGSCSLIRIRTITYKCSNHVFGRIIMLKADLLDNSDV